MAKRYFSPLTNIDFNTYGGRFKKGVVNGGLQQTTKGSTFSIYADDVILSTDYTGSYDSLSPGNINLIPTGAVFIGNSVTPPTDTPSNGGYLYASNGSLTYKSSDGSVTAMGIVKAQEVLWGISGAYVHSYEITAQTSNATKTTIFTYTPPANSVNKFQIDLTARDITNGAMWSGTINDAGLKTINGSISAVGTLPLINPNPNGVDSELSTCTATIEISGTTIIVTITGVLATSIKWLVQVGFVELV
jgi:hypothetical protein